MCLWRSTTKKSQTDIKHTHTKYTPRSCQSLRMVANKERGQYCHFNSIVVMWKCAQVSIASTMSSTTTTIMIIIRAKKNLFALFVSIDSDKSGGLQRGNEWWWSGGFDDDDDANKIVSLYFFFFTVNIEDQLHLCIDELDNSPWSNCI